MAEKGQVSGKRTTIPSYCFAFFKKLCYTVFIFFLQEECAVPFIHTRVNRPISKEAEQTLAKAYGEAISLLPGKSEQWLMLQFEENCRLWFRGQNENAQAFVQVQAFGKNNAAACDALTARICALLEEHLHISPENINVRYDETALWGWNGANF